MGPDPRGPKKYVSTQIRIRKTIPEVIEFAKEKYINIRIDPEKEFVYIVR